MVVVVVVVVVRVDAAVVVVAVVGEIPSLHDLQGDKLEEEQTRNGTE